MTDREKFQTLSRRRAEEEFFLRRDIELVRQRRAALDRVRRAQEDERVRQQYWMKCPKCGTRLVDQEHAYVRIETCPGCGGMFLDRGELELILRMNRKDTFLDHLAHWLDRVFTQGFDIPKGPSPPPKR